MTVTLAQNLARQSAKALPAFQILDGDPNNPLHPEGEPTTPAITCDVITLEACAQKPPIPSLPATRDDLNRLAHDAIPLEKSLLVLVGDKSLILEQTKDLPLPKPVEMTVAGEQER